MRPILSLDIGETLLMEFGSRYRPLARPYAELFLRETRGLFAERYFNSTDIRETATPALTKCFPLEIWSDFRFLRHSNKAVPLFGLDGQVIHVEDGGMLPDERRDFALVGALYLTVPTWDVVDVREGVPIMAEDDALLAALDIIRDWAT